jgi:uncharacterized BrkB/YihY/UPF0761 family membrane protein
MIALVFLYLSALFFIFGGELNAAIGRALDRDDAAQQPGAPAAGSAT